jgi:cytochrome c oxidase cbb3-type subunit 3
MARPWVWLLLLLPITAGSQQGWGPDNETDSHESGRRVYNTHCYFCHGYRGDARTLASTFLKPPPRSFSRLAPDDLSREAMLRAVREGRAGTAMPGFDERLEEDDIEAVVTFIRREFVEEKKSNAGYHAPENGWSPPGASPAAPFATGELPLDSPWESLSPEQRAGKRLFLSTCVSCHDRGMVRNGGPVWEPEAVSYPPGGYAHVSPEDAAAVVPFYELHERPPALAASSATERRGEQLFQANCAHCHAADGTGRNWVGSFLEPRPPDLTDPQVMAALSPERLAGSVRDGRSGTAMPAWRGVLDASEIDALITYMLRAFAAPPADGAGRNPPPGS